jgi:hypothetical protein
MKHIAVNFLMLFFLFIACEVRKNDKTITHIKKDSVHKPDVQHVSVILNWPAPVYHKFKDVESLFVKSDLGRYDCSYLEEYYTDNNTKLNTADLFQVNENVCKKIFGDYRNDYGAFCSSYLYSIENPIQNFYPITVIQNFGVAERPIIMLLYNAKAEIAASFEVANLYGETGGCLSSYFINDSTLIQNFKWDDFGVDTLTQQDIYESAYMTQELTISKNGEVHTKELKRWKAIGN